jgi:Kinesin motor domain
MICRVLSKVRPLHSEADSSLSSSAVEVVGNSIRAGSSSFEFDGIIDDCDESIRDMAVLPGVGAISRGINATIFSYGPSGSGKSHLMCIVLRLAFSELLRGDRDSALAGQARFFVSCIEVYNNSISDLIGGDSALTIRETAAGPIGEPSHHV